MLSSDTTHIMPRSSTHVATGIRKRKLKVYFDTSDAAAVRRAVRAGFGFDDVEISDLGGATMTQAVGRSARGFRSGSSPHVVITRLRRKAGRRFLRPWLWVTALRHRANKENDPELDLRGREAAMLRLFFGPDAPTIPLMRMN